MLLPDRLERLDQSFSGCLLGPLHPFSFARVFVCGLFGFSLVVCLPLGVPIFCISPF